MPTASERPVPEENIRDKLLPIRSFDAAASHTTSPPAARDTLLGSIYTGNTEILTQLFFRIRYVFIGTQGYHLEMTSCLLSSCLQKSLTRAFMSSDTTPALQNYGKLLLQQCQKRRPHSSPAQPYFSALHVSQKTFMNIIYKQREK